MTRVLMLHEDQRQPGQGGGAESLLRDQTEALHRLGCEVAWLHSGQIERACEQFKPDIVHVGTVHNFIGLRPVEWLQVNKVPHLWAIMDYWPWCGPRMLLRTGSDESCSAVAGECDNACNGRAAERLSVVNGSPVVALNEHTAAIYRRHGLRVDYVVELGVDTEVFRPEPGQRTAEPSIWASSAWPEYPPKGMRHLHAAIKGTKLQVNLMAHTTRENIARGLKRGHVYAFPSVYQETWGLCLTEAMASGLAVVASDVAGPRAQVHEGLGVLVAPRDPLALRGWLEWLVAHPQAASEYGERARAHVVAEHSLEAMGRRWLAVYKQILGG